MDWKNLKDQVTKMAKKGFDISKEYVEKTGVWSYAKLKDSKFSLKEIADYEIYKEEKRYAIFCIRDNDVFTKSFLTILLPIAFTKAWIESGFIRIILEEGTEDLRKSLGIDSIPSAIIKMNDGTIRKIINEEEIRTFMKTFSFYTCTNDENTETK